MKDNEKLAQYIANKLWLQTSKVLEVINDFKGDENKETPTVKHPIELVNERYPNGWYCEAFEEVVEDVVVIDNRNENTIKKWELIGWNFIDSIGYNACHKGNKRIMPFATLIAKSEYLSITRPTEQPQQRDYTGVRFKDNHGEEWILGRNSKGYYRWAGGFHYSQEEVEYLISKCEWIEIPNKPSSIHVEKPNTLEDRVKALELAVFPTKRNLPVDNDDWKKAECLSFKEIVDVFLFSAGCKIELENYIKEKLSKK